MISCRAASYKKRLAQPHQQLVAKLLQYCTKYPSTTSAAGCCSSAPNGHSTSLTLPHPHSTSRSYRAQAAVVAVGKSLRLAGYKDACNGILEHIRQRPIHQVELSESCRRDPTAGCRADLLAMGSLFRPDSSNQCLPTRLSQGERFEGPVQRRYGRHHLP